MSKKFKTQDYFRYKKLGKRWRRPVGLQSKLRIKKGGSGNNVSIGHRTPLSLRDKIDGLDVTVVHNMNDLSKVGDCLAIVASGVGARKTKMIYDKAKEMGVSIVNMKKIRQAQKKFSSIEKKRAEKKKTKEAEKKKERPEEEKIKDNDDVSEQSKSEGG